ncbi:hypothetical protein, partial [Massilia genomosp. 1]|uniref:hypothetical protein n=1 Tax=Massilia genomosp. 1 TaxID=2609280 RepID=UPI001C9E8747
HTGIVAVLADRFTGQGLFDLCVQFLDQLVFFGMRESREVGKRASFTMTGIMPGYRNVYNCAFTTVRAKQLREN